MGNQSSKKKTKIPKQGGVVGGSASRPPANHAERRQKLAERYEKGNKVDKLIASKRQEKARAELEEAAANGGKPNAKTFSSQGISGLSGAPPSEPVNPEVAAKLERDRKALEQSNFNFTETVIAQSGQARTKIGMGGFDTPSSSSTAHSEVAKTVAKTDKATSKEVPENDFKELAASIRNAIEACDRELIQTSLHAIRETGNQSVTSGLEAEIREAELLLSTLDVSSNSLLGDAAVDTDAFQSEISSIVQTALENHTLVPSHVSTLKTLRKLFSNVIEHPTEPTYHRVKMSNKTVNTRLIETAGGAGKRALEAAGFASTFVAEISEQCLVVAPEAIGVMIDNAQELLEFIDHSISQLESIAP